MARQVEHGGRVGGLEGGGGGRSGRGCLDSELELGREEELCCAEFRGELLNVLSAVILPAGMNRWHVWHMIFEIRVMVAWAADVVSDWPHSRHGFGGSDGRGFPLVCDDRCFSCASCMCGDDDLRAERDLREEPDELVFFAVVIGAMVTISFSVVPFRLLGL